MKRLFSLPATIIVLSAILLSVGYTNFNFAHEVIFGHGFGGDNTHG